MDLVSTYKQDDLRKSRKKQQTFLDYLRENAPDKNDTDLLSESSLEDFIRYKALQEKIVKDHYRKKREEKRQKRREKKHGIIERTDDISTPSSF